MDDSYKHTSAAEMEEFLTKSPSEQSLRIWLSARETDAHVNEARRDIDVMGKEIQTVRLTFSDHAVNHLSPAEAGEIRRWVDRLKFLLVLATAALVFQPTLIAIALWLLKSS